MSRFVLIDHSLVAIGGHNYQYAVDVLTAAESQGFEPVLVANQAFTMEEIPSTWQVFRPFQFVSDKRDWLGPDGTATRPVDISGRIIDDCGYLACLIDRLYRPNRQKRILDFRNGCALVFDELKIVQQDRVFFSTFNEFDLLGLAAFIRQSQPSRTVDWHVQFHFNIFKGREPSYASQEQRANAIRQQISKALEAIQDHRIHFYCTTRKVAQQYNRLGVADFQTLPYAVSMDFQHVRSSESQTSPVRITMAGCIRREKGKHQLRQLFRAMQPELNSGSLQFVVNGSVNRVTKLVAIDGPRVENDREDATAEVLCAPYPMSRKNYVRLINNADVGVFMYDWERYYTRCSGVLVEMLAAGIPVIVPAACWLADQISSSIDDSRRQLLMEATTVGVETSEYCDNTTIMKLKSLPAAQQDVSTRLVVPLSASYLAVTVHGGVVGSYVRVSCGTASAGSHYVEIQPLQGMGKGMISLFPLSENDQTIVLSLSNAFDNVETQIDSVDIQFVLNAEDKPMGCVGLIAAMPEQFPRLIRHMVRHHSYFSQTAAEFSIAWRQLHRPENTVHLLNVNSSEIALQRAS